MIEGPDRNLAESLLAFAAARGGDPLPEELAGVLVSLVRSAAPWETPAADVTFGLLSEAQGCRAPEVRIGLFCLRGAMTADEIASLLDRPLWEPVRWLAYRALAHFGWRTTLARLLSRNSPAPIVEADAGMEATQPPQWRPLPLSGENSSWITLLQAERDPERLEPSLRELASSGIAGEARDYDEAQRVRITVRSMAALARLELSRGGDPSLWLACDQLPRWEAAYFRGLAEWRKGARQAACEHLRGALGLNPEQTAIRLALSCILASESLEEALSLTEHREPTRDLLIHRAAILVRLQRYQEAGEALDTEANWEAQRFSWPRGQVALLRQERLLRLGLAERRKDWAGAEKQLEVLNPGGNRQLWGETRKLFIAKGQLQEASTAGRWSREFVERRWNRLNAGLRAGPLPANASFFRAAALLEEDAGKAREDLAVLRADRAWQQREQAVGGGRLGFLGDALLRFGLPQEAAAVYRSMRGCEVRMAVAEVCACLARWASPEEIKAAAHAPSAPDHPWPELFAALALLVLGEGRAARELLDAAAGHGAPRVICLRLRALVGELFEAASPSEDKLVALGLPRPLAATVCLTAMAGSNAARMDLCLANPARAARQALQTWIEEGRWEDALKLARDLTRSGGQWARELGELVFLRRALELARRGQLVESQTQLRELRHGFVR